MTQDPRVPEGRTENVVPVDPAIPLAPDASWRVPAGWVPTVNALHHELVALVGAYRLTGAWQKAGRLRYIAEFPDVDDPLLRVEARRLISEAQQRTAAICEVCGEPGEHAVVSTRCAQHPARRGPGGAPGVIAPRPGE